MEHSTGWLSTRIYYVAAGLFFGAVLLRSFLIYGSEQELPAILLILAAWLVLFLLQPALSSRWSGFFPLYLLTQTALVFGLLLMPGSPDFFSTLLLVLSMQGMLNMEPRAGAAWISVVAVLLVVFLSFSSSTGDAIALSIIFTAGNVLMGTYTLATRRAEAARLDNRALALKVEEANAQLQAYSTQLGSLAVARERNRLARELHDSVTQTVFSMTLSTQSARLLLDKDPTRVPEQLDHLNQLARSALSEMQVLISELRPDLAAWEGLLPALRRHLSSTHIPKDLPIDLELTGAGTLNPNEEQGLFRIIQEALNNMVKHAQADHAAILIHLEEPFRVEIRDNGRGFDLEKSVLSAPGSDRVGLASMRERAEEIGWLFQVNSSPGQGVTIILEREPVKERLR